MPSSLPIPAPLESLNLSTAPTGSDAPPRRKIFTSVDLAAWHSSRAYADLEQLALELCHAVEGKRIEDDCHESRATTAIVAFLKETEGWIDQVPLQTTPQRFGNKAFRDWLARVEERNEPFQRSLLSDSKRAESSFSPPNLASNAAIVSELSFHFLTSFGSGPRLDYGTGHELSFLLWVLSLRLVDVLTHRDDRAIVLRIFAAYIDLVRKLQRVFRLEPAGSKGVWGLDDHQHLVYLFGASQLIDHPTLRPSHILQPRLLAPLSSSFLLPSSILHIHTLKTGPFAEHSPLLHQIATTVPNWNKVQSGLWKMYKEEVLNKVPVVQHLRFGALVRWTSMDSEQDLPSTGDGKADDDDDENDGTGTAFEEMTAPWVKPSPSQPSTILPSGTTVSSAAARRTPSSGLGPSRISATPRHPATFAPPPLFPTRTIPPRSSDAGSTRRTLADEGGAAAQSSPFGILSSATSTATAPTMTASAPDVARLTQQADDLFALRDKLSRSSKQAKKGKGVATPPQASGQAADASGTSVDHAAAFSLVLEILSAPPTVIPSASKGSGVPSTTLVAFETLELLLRRAQSVVDGAAHPDELDSVRSQLSPTFLVSLSNALYSSWDIQTISIQTKVKSTLVLLLALASASALDLPEVPQQLKAKILADPWNNKRSLYSFEALLPHLDIEEFAAFSASPNRDIPEGVVQRIVDGILLSEDSAPMAGRVGVSWIQHCWARQARHGASDQTFWIRPILDACRRCASSNSRQNLCIYLVTGICSKRKEAFKELLSAGGYLFEGEDGTGDLSDADLETALAILRVGNSLNLVQLDSTSTSEASHKVALPTALLETTLFRSSPALRIDTLSLLVLSPSTSTPLPHASFPLLRAFYQYSLGDEEGDIRMQTISLTGKLLLRLRDSAWKAKRTANKGKDDAKEAQEYVDAVRAWLEWWLKLVGDDNLNPARPYRLKMNSLRMLDLAFQARVDLRYRVDEEGTTGDDETGKSKRRDKRDATTGYSTYRKTASTQTPMFNAKHRTSAAAEEGPWPFSIDLVTPRTTQVLLRQFLSTYTAIRSLCISTLERFPAPLPGYEGFEGADKAKRELLVPALRMIRSGREADASAGAGVVGLVWRKWILESLERNDGSVATWTLGEVGGWAESETTRTGPPGFAFLSSLLDLAGQDLALYEANLGHAASTIPMHGTILALRHLFISIPSASYHMLSSPEDRRALFHRALDVVKRVWDVTAPVLAAKGLEEAAKEGEADTEEARAIKVQALAEKGPDPADDDGEYAEAEGMRGPQYKIILNACWRAVKEASELLETLLRLPSELGAVAFRSIWTFDEICSIGDLFADWLRRIRHRGAAMTLHPCYARAAGALLVAGEDWPEVGKLPEQWLSFHLESIVSSRISFTRRSAAIPYLLVGLLTTILPASRSAFEGGFARLFEIAESTSADIPDESRVHAMNTLRTAFLDAKCGGVVGPFVERAFLLSISLFWSTNWILRNVAMMLFSSLITRAFNAKRTNLDRDYASLSKRLTIDDFFGRYPTLRNVLRDELERGWNESQNELPTSSLQSSIFAILMLLSLLQTPDSVETAGVQSAPSLAEPFHALVEACASSRVWKIRDAAGDALTGLVAPAQVPGTCLAIFADLPKSATSTTFNEVHGRLGQVLRLLRTVPALSRDAEARVSSAYLELAETILPDSTGSPIRPRFPASILSAFLLISLYLPTALKEPRQHVVTFAAASLSQAAEWTSSAYHLPTSEDFLKTCWQVLYAASTSAEERLQLVATALDQRSLEVKREALVQIAAVVEEDSDVVHALAAPLLRRVVDAMESPDVRVSAVEILREPRAPAVGHDAFPQLQELFGTTASVPLREGLLPVLASAALADDERDAVLKAVEQASRPVETSESREASALALRVLQRTSADRPLSPAEQTRFDLCLLRLLQDDDPETRSIAFDAARSSLVEGKAVESLLEHANADLAALVLADEQTQFEEDLDLMSNPSSLLFEVEKPNIYRDDHLVPSLLRSTSPTQTENQLSRLSPIISSGRGMEDGPLGRDGNELVCKWAGPLVERWTSAGTDAALDTVVGLLRSST
ncbi:hypothetical protein JCM10212_001683 [Sporobolomyces blumeae]